MTEERMLGLLEARDYKELKLELANMHPVDIAESMEELSEKQMFVVFRLLGKEDAAETFTYMDSETREWMINALSDSELKEVMDEMHMDDAVDVLEELPANVVDRILESTDEETRAHINELLQYPPDSAGSLMTVEYITLHKDMTVADAIMKIRQIGINKETIYTCYVTEKRKLIGEVSVQDLLASSDSKTMEEVMETNVICVHTHDDQEDVVKQVRKYGLFAIPVVDGEFCLVGLVTVDDAMEVLQEETTEDMSIMAGMSPVEESYFGTSVFKHAKSRTLWLLVLMLSSTITSYIIMKYEAAFVSMPALVGYIPMLSDTGGNCGSQSSSLIIRGLSVDEIKFKDIFRVIFKEFRVAILVSIFLAVVNGVRVMIFQGDIRLAVAIGLTLVCTIVLSKMIGCTLPMFAQMIHVDPAIMAAPLITTIVDSCSVMVYFAIVTKLLHIG